MCMRRAGIFEFCFPSALLGVSNYFLSRFFCGISSGYYREFVVCEGVGTVYLAYYEDVGW